MIEVAMVFDVHGKVIHWHLPPGRHAGAIPDSRDLWEVMWENREILGGVAHTHPWHGEPWPSQTDVTTFRACEQGLGKLLLWPVVTFSDVGYWAFNPVTKEYVLAVPNQPSFELEGIDELRRRSGWDGT
tara:strand:+ start:4257 stop:4643 length:387 start_codon:yes stop_codon:yes gene_type:complete